MPTSVSDLTPRRISPNLGVSLDAKPTMKRTVLIINLIALLSAGTAAATDSVLLDATRMSEKAITDAQARSEWWLGFEHNDAASANKDPRMTQFSAAKMLLIGVKDAAPWRKSAGLLSVFADTTAADFAIQSATHCNHHHMEMLPAIAEIGRGNLVLKPKTLLAYDDLDFSPIPTQQWVASRSRTLASKAINPAIQAIVQQIDGTRWFADVTQLGTWKRNSFSPEVDLARDWIAQQFNGFNLLVQTPTFTVPTPSTVQMENVIGTQVGTTLPNEWIVVGAHYDSTNSGISNVTNPSPGAEDNASGCAGVIEIARVLRNYQFRRSIKYVCFGGEEQGLYGSEAFAAGVQSAGELSRIKLAVTMDMIGFSSDTRFDVLLETSSALQAVLPEFQQAAADYVPDLAVLTSLNPFGSDHMPFINRSVPALLLIEDEYDTYTHYHRSTDTPANVTNATQQGPRILKTAIAVIANQAGLESSFKDGFE